MWDDTALPIESYNKNSFQQLWELLELSNDKILGINWDERDINKIQKQLINLNFNLKDSKSPNLIGFNFQFKSGDIIDGNIAFTENRTYYDFHFVFKRANNLIDWLIEKYGDSLRLRDDMQLEYKYDWIHGNILIQAEMAKLSTFVSLDFSKCAIYIKLIKGEIDVNEFLKNTETK